jgi:hypothetical protein
MHLAINTSTDDNANTQKAGVSTSRSNIRTKSISIIEADLDGDGEFESMKVLAGLCDGATKDITVYSKMSTTALVKKVTIRGWDPQKKQEIAGSADASKEFTISIDNDNAVLLTNQRENGTKEEIRVVAKVSHHPNVVQFVIPMDDPDGTNSEAKIKTKSNIKNDRVTDDDVNGDGLNVNGRITKSRSNIQNNRMINEEDDNIWSPRSNIKMIHIAAADADGDGAADLVAGNLFKQNYFETGDKPTQNQRTVGGFVPGGSVISSALRPGNPIGGLTIKGGKNPGGNSRTVQTNENGEFEFPGLEAGDYTFTIEQRLILEDETFVTVGGDAAENIVTSESNLKDVASPKKGDVKITASQKSQALRTIKQDIGPDNEEIKNNNDGNNPVTKAQNNNTVRSNRTDNALIDFFNNSGSNDITIDEGGQSKPKGKSNVGPVKWMAPEAMKAAINTSHSNIKNLLASLDQLNGQLNADNSNAKSIINTSRSNIKNQRVAINALEETLDNLQTKDKDEAMNELDQRIAAMNMQFLSLQESLTKLGRQYNSISNVLKSRHESAMNSIRNMK